MSIPITTPIGSFSKGVKGACAINFAPSGGSNCSASCSLKRAGICYATSVEHRKPSVTVNLERKQDNLTLYLQTLLTPKSSEKLQDAPWIRFSAFGSVPAPPALDDVQRTLFRDLTRICDPAKTHLPLETRAKYRAYRDLGFHPRLSLGIVARPLSAILSAYVSGIDHMSIVAPSPDKKPGWTKRAITAAFDLRDKLAGENPDLEYWVCPAIAGTAKCGDCTACAGTEDNATVVIYPEHP